MQGPSTDRRQDMGLTTTARKKAVDPLAALPPMSLMPSHGVANAAQLLSLQRSVGNAATVKLMQRRLSVKSTTLEELSTGGAPGTSKIGRLKGATSGSTFNAIRDAFTRYERARSTAGKLEGLQKVDRLATRWLNEHTSVHDAISRRRRAVLQQLVDEAPSEMAALSSGMAEDIYAANVANAGAEPNNKSKDPGEKFALNALSDGAKTEALSPNYRASDLAIAETYGLSQPQIMAIRIFTTDDYKYINPATKNDMAWMADNKAKSDTDYGAFSRGATDATMAEEGTVNAGVAMRGLLKLPPDPAEVYRGATFWDREFADKVAVGKVFSFPAFASASKSRRTADQFAQTNGRDHAVILKLRNSGGRDISKISAVKAEKEVTLLAGSKYSVTKVTALPDRPGDKRKWYEVELGP